MKKSMSILSISLRSLPSRLAPSLIIIVGIAGVVAVLVSLLSMARGFEQTLKSTGHDDRAIILRAGSTSEINGNIPIDQFGIIRDLPIVASANRVPLAAMETFVTVNLPQREQAAGDANVPMRGIDQNSFLVRSEVHIVSGRSIEFGKYELVAGRSAAAQFAGLEVGQHIKIRGVEWLVVGLFSASGSAYESEMWVDERLLAATWARGDKFSSTLLQLATPDDFEVLSSEIESDRRLTAHAIRESEYYARQSKNTTDLITGVGLLVGMIMSLGAVFAALNTMFTALSKRVAEISTLRTLGFERISIVGSILLESMLLALIGALFGGGLVFLALNNISLSTVAATSATFTQVAFKFLITTDLLITGIGLAILLGFIGGLIPALTAVRLPITQGLRKG